MNPFPSDFFPSLLGQTKFSIFPLMRNFWTFRRTAAPGTRLEFSVCHARVPPVERELETARDDAAHGHNQGGAHRRTNDPEYGRQLRAAGTGAGRCDDGLRTGRANLQHGETLQPSLFVRERGEGESRVSRGDQSC